MPTPKHTFLFLTEWLEHLAPLSDKDFRSVITAISDFIETGELPSSLSDNAQKAFVNISADLNNSRKMFHRLAQVLPPGYSIAEADVFEELLKQPDKYKIIGTVPPDDTQLADPAKIFD